MFLIVMMLRRTMRFPSEKVIGSQKSKLLPKIGGKEKTRVVTLDCSLVRILFLLPRVLLVIIIMMSLYSELRGGARVNIVKDIGTFSSTRLG